jgi:ABC-2 type transport system ATP-binding protein
LSLLVFEGVKKSYGEIAALRGVSFEVRRGEIFGLLGPNGAGKTTLIRILMDILRPNEGAIRLFGKSHAADTLDGVTYLPEERGLYVKHRVIDVMTYFGNLKGLTRAESRRRALAWLERVGLSETALWRVTRLSKGMSQKVQIAATLMTDPELCVLDEPFSGLDPVNVRLVEDLLKERRAAGRTTILSTHQMNLVESLCDRVALIDKGFLMIYGEVEEVRRRFSKAEVRVRLSSAMPTIEGVESVIREDEGAYRLVLGEGTEPRAVLAALVSRDAGVESFERCLAPMEEVFIQVVKRGAGASAAASNPAAVSRAPEGDA